MRETDRRIAVSPLVRASVSPDGLVLLDVAGGVLLASNAVGARIWQLIEQQLAARDIAVRLVEEYAVPAERAEHDVAAFIAALRERRLVRTSPAC